MEPVLSVSVLWIASMWGSTFLFPMFTSFYPNLFLLSILFIAIRWKGPEIYFIAVLFGLTADTFSATFFGLGGLSFFLVSFLARWMAIKVIQETFLSILFFCTINLFAVYFIQNFVLILVETGIGFFPVFGRQLLFRFIPTILLAYPGYRLFVRFDKVLNIKLSERKF